MLLPQFFAPFHTLSSKRFFGVFFADGGKPRCDLFFSRLLAVPECSLELAEVVSSELPWGSAQLSPFINIQVRQLPGAFLAAGRRRAAGCSHLPLFLCRNSHFLGKQFGLMILEVFSKLFLESRSAIHSKKAAVICCRSLSLLLQLYPPPEQSRPVDLGSWGALGSGYGQWSCLSHSSPLP